MFTEDVSGVDLPWDVVEVHHTGRDSLPRVMVGQPVPAFVEGRMW